MRISTIPCLLASLLLIPCAAAVASASPKPARPLFYYDLGPDSIDVSAYPKAKRDEYAVFTHVCSQCHTLSRPINAPVITRRDWSHFIKRMHGRTRLTAGAKITPVEARQVLDFLVFDARVRKVERRGAFLAQAKRLKEEFVQAKAENARADAARDRAETRDTPMATLTQPHPQPQAR